VERLRLFPLQTVLFPGMTLRLVVFEPRYRQLVRECLDAGEPFGIALIREGVEVGGPAVPYPVGTTARIRDVAGLGDGRLRVEVVGERKFRIVRLHDDRPYLSADVELPVDDPGPPAADLYERARERYRQVKQLQLTAAGGYERNIEAPNTPSELAAAIGGLDVGSVSERQRLLEASDGATQVRLAAELLESALEQVHAEAARRVADRYGSAARLN
jgi:Lon protease-like protein